MEIKLAELKIAQHSLNVYKDAYEKEPNEMHSTLAEFWQRVVDKLTEECNMMRKTCS